MPTPRQHPPFGRKSESRPQIFSVTVVSEPDGRKPADAVRIFSVLHARRVGAAAIAELAAAQRGLVSAGQLTEAGVTRAAIRTLVAHAALHPILPRVYAVGTPELQPLAAETAALLHLGRDAVISHGSAAALWDLAVTPDRVQVTLIGRGLRPRDGLQLHRVPRLDPRDVRLRHGLPVTAPGRALVDFAAEADGDALDAAVAQARVRCLIDDGELQDAMARAQLRTGAARLRRLLQTPEGTARTRSWLERRLLRLLRAAGLPLPQFNAVVHGLEVDALWREQRLVLEADGWEFHHDRASFEADRARDQRLVAHGYRVIRITHRQLEREPMAVVSRIAAALAV